MGRRTPRRLSRLTALLAWGAIVVCAAVPVAAAPGGATSFRSSFEAGDPAPDWQDTPDQPAGGAHGVLPDTGTLPGSVMAAVTAVTASGTAAGHPPSQAVDGDAGTVWTAPAATGYLQLQLSASHTVTTYAITSAPDSPALDPASWQLLGSADGQAWTTVDTRAGQTFGQRGQTRLFSVAHPGEYSSYRLAITGNHGDADSQLAELALAERPATAPGMTASVGTGPAAGPTSKANVGYTGTHALRYAGWQTGAGGAATDEVYQVRVAVRRDTRLSYKIFPEFTGADLSYPSTYVAVDLVFSDGSRLSQLGATDANGIGLSARAQGDGEALFARQWNSVSADLGRVAAGRTVVRIDVSYDDPHGPAHFGGWLDDVTIGAAPAGPDCAHPSRCVVTTRGTNSTGDYSRGNTFPAVAVPHGFTFWTPETDAGSTGTLYAWQQQNDAANEPTIQAFGASHEPSIWVQDRQTFQVMPSTSDAPATADRATRALPFSHDHETARADYYGVTFDNGLRTEITPTDHAAVFRFTFPSGGDSLLFDNVNDNGGLTLDPATGTLSGYSDVSGFWGAPRMFVYATFDRPMSTTGTLAGGRPHVSGYAHFDLGGSDAVSMRVATSFISVAQARHNLDLEVGDRSFDQVRRQAQRTWDKALGVISVRGASADQQVSLYSDLYRLNLYPNELSENVGTAAEPRYQYASPYSPKAGADTPTSTGSAVRDGQPYANEGFWDTSRAAWPLDALLYPQLTGKMIDGFVQQYRDGGWIGQWTAPGYLSFGGTTSDVSIADAYLRGVTGFDVTAAYEAAVKDATVPGAGVTGRPEVTESTFLGYIPASVGSSASTSLDNYQADYGIAQLSKALYDKTKKREYLDNYTYFSDRAENYAKLFDPRVGFFQPRNADGTFAQGASQFDSLNWNANDYTEGDAWTYAFSVPQDGQGLAALYGGRAGLAQKLDGFFGTPETAQYGGGWFGPYHEMFESRDDRLGQWAYNDQPSMHVAYLYDYVGQPSKTQRYVRSAMARTFTGSDIGQGYPGDEDNGSMSAFYLANALGLYPLQTGSPTWAIGSPLYPHATIRPIGGKPITLDAPATSTRNTYVQGMTVDGHRYDKTYLTESDLARGGHITFAMGNRPSSWGTGAGDAPPSPTDGTVVSDLTSPGGAVTASGGVDAAALVDNTSATQVTFPAGPATVQYRLDKPERIAQYTLTSGAQAGDPTGWTLEGSADGTHWQQLDQRSGESFAWRQQTRAFTPASGGSYQYYRITLAAGSAPIHLSEVELLGN
jgi:predicted alpha-1,2-mannosidase